MVIFVILRKKGRLETEEKAMAVEEALTYRSHATLLEVRRLPLLSSATTPPCCECGSPLPSRKVYTLLLHVDPAQQFKATCHFIIEFLKPSRAHLNTQGTLLLDEPGSRIPSSLSLLFQGLARNGTQ